MVKSMTGFGKGICSSENVDVSVEIKSINSRYFDFSPKTPKLLNNFDDELIKLVKSKCERGRITLTCTVQYNSNIDNLVSLNTEKISNYIKISKEIQSKLDTDTGISVDQLMRFNDIYLINEKSEISQELRCTFFNAVNDSINNLNKSRDDEGNNLKQDLIFRLGEITNYVTAIQSITKEHRNKDFKRYKNKILELLNDTTIVDESRLLQEVAIIAEKKDITEEIIRLFSHIQVYNGYFKDKDNSGKKMNFMLQEMGREINTIGSKTDQIEVSHLVVSLKDELEKMREQVQNIL